MSTIRATFKAFEYAKFGDVLKEVKLNRSTAQKALQAGEVRVKVLSAAVDPIDYKLAQYGAAILPTAPSAENPFRDGMDLAGTIVELGSGVTGFAVGDTVFASSGMGAMGSLGEYLNVKAKVLTPKPSNMTFNEAAGVPLAGLTSYQALVTYGKLQAGQRVLILGGSGDTGVFAIQIAKALGAEVVATSSFRNTALLESLGADQTVDYTKEKWSDVLGEHSVDLIYDCGMESVSWNAEAQKVLKPKTGVFVTLDQMQYSVASPIDATLHQIFGMPAAADLLELKKLIEAGKVKTVVDSVYPLEKVLEAMKVQMSGRAKGKIIIEVAKE